MNEFLKIFTSQEHMEFEGYVYNAKKEANAVPLKVAYTLLSVVLLIPLGILDWEIFYRIFRDFNGQDNLWSPKLMAFTGTVMLVAYHVLAGRHPKHMVVKVVSGLTGLIIVAFMVGGGLYIADMLYVDIGEAPEADIPLPNQDTIEAEANQDWIGALFKYFTSPTAKLALSLGIGGLSIVALYIAHHLLHVIEKNISDIYTQKSNLRRVLALLKIINQSEIKMAELKTQEYELSFQNSEYCMQFVGEEVLEVISKELLPHEQILQEDKISAPVNPRWEQTPIEDKKHIAAMIKKIRAITLSDILKAMTLPKTLRK